MSPREEEAGRPEPASDAGDKAVRTPSRDEGEGAEAPPLPLTPLLPCTGRGGKVWLRNAVILSMIGLTGAPVFFARLSSATSALPFWALAWCWG